MAGAQGREQPSWPEQGHLSWVLSGELEFTKKLSRGQTVFQGTETSMSVGRSEGVEGGLEVQKMRPPGVSHSTNIYQVPTVC